MFQSKRIAGRKQLKKESQRSSWPKESGKSVRANGTVHSWNSEDLSMSGRRSSARVSCCVPYLCREKHPIGLPPRRGRPEVGAEEDGWTIRRKLVVEDPTFHTQRNLDLFFKHFLGTTTQKNNAECCE